MARPNQYTNEQIITALKETKGLVYLAAKRVGCVPNTIYARAKISPDVAECMMSQRGEVIDTGELRLFEAVDRGEPWAVGMVLKTLGKNRGYVERTETRAITDEDIDRAIDETLGRVAGRGQTARPGPAEGAGGED